jgi:hypothetical protein
MYPIKPEADRSLSNLSLDDEFKPGTPIKVETKTYNPKLSNYNPPTEIVKIENPGIEIIKTKKKNMSIVRAEEVKNPANSVHVNEVEFKREGSMAPAEKRDPNKIWQQNNGNRYFSDLFRSRPSRRL